MYYRQLSLPGDPLLPTAVNYIRTSEGSRNNHRYVFTDVDKLFKPEVLDTISKIGLSPYCVVVPVWDTAKVNKPKEVVTEYNCTPIHSDLVLYNDQWANYPCAINWELNHDSDVTWHWWRSNDSYIPAYTNRDPTHKYLEGTRTSNSVLIEKVKLLPFTPLLVNTTVPHCIEFNLPSTTRIAISLRFNYPELSTWDQALEIFGPLFM